ncbi:hypothetical protein CDD81_6928 [Ophiocordyceps australis]|uniref:Uncharacterized protein n=1 Tax=Ophiocordyceps australis TaxID=1399860 RepID=A0A2C5Y5M8_9HYPO|nr:hypothetical protein CDD81_6928 [Ophiocordyceps australis]
MSATSDNATNAATSQPAVSRFADDDLIEYDSDDLSFMKSGLQPAVSSSDTHTIDAGETESEGQPLDHRALDTVDKTSALEAAPEAQNSQVDQQDPGTNSSTSPGMTTKLEATSNIQDIGTVTEARIERFEIDWEADVVGEDDIDNERATEEAASPHGDAAGQVTDLSHVVETGKEVLDSASQHNSPQEPSSAHEPSKSESYPDITVYYRGQQYPFFSPTSDGFFSDTSILDENMQIVLDGFRAELVDEIGPYDDIVLQVDKLGLEFSESSPRDTLVAINLRRLLALHDILVKNHDPDSARVLSTRLFTRPNAMKRYEFLVESATQDNKGLAEVVYSFDDSYGGNSPDSVSLLEEDNGVHENNHDDGNESAVFDAHEPSGDEDDAVDMTAQKEDAENLLAQQEGQLNEPYSGDDDDLIEYETHKNNHDDGDENEVYDTLEPSGCQGEVGTQQEEEENQIVRQARQSNEPYGGDDDLIDYEMGAGDVEAKADDQINADDARATRSGPVIEKDEASTEPGVVDEVNGDDEQDDLDQGIETGNMQGSVQYNEESLHDEGSINYDSDQNEGATGANVTGMPVAYGGDHVSEHGFDENLIDYSAPANPSDDGFNGKEEDGPCDQRHGSGGTHVANTLDAIHHSESNDAVAVAVDEDLIDYEGVDQMNDGTSEGQNDGKTWPNREERNVDTLTAERDAEMEIYVTDDKLATEGQSRAYDENDDDLIDYSDDKVDAVSYGTANKAIKGGDVKVDEKSAQTLVDIAVDEAKTITDAASKDDGFFEIDWHDDDGVSHVGQGIASAQANAAKRPLPLDSGEVDRNDVKRRRS